MSQPGVIFAALPASFITLFLLLSLGSACAPTGRAVSLQLSRNEITPDTRGDRVEVRYRVERPARVKLALIGLDGTRHELRRDEPRSPGFDYVYSFDGTVAAPDDPEQRRVLADGVYRVMIESIDSSGRIEEVSQQLTVRGADGQPPMIENLAAYPVTVSPNYDGLDDVATISYRLSKRARIQQFATDQAGNRVYVGRTEVQEPGEYAERWDGTAREKPAADGRYQYHVQATDAAGNVVVARVPIDVAAGGRPEGRIVRVDFSPQHLMVGQVLTVRALVRNTGALPLRTQGPDSGYVYNSFDSFGSVEGRQFIDRAGVWRLGVDWAGSPISTGSKYPYRWGLGRGLQPGQETTVEGQLRIDHGPALDRQTGPLNNRIFIYAGLIHEGIAFHDDRVGGAWIEIGY